MTIFRHIGGGGGGGGDTVIDAGGATDIPFVNSAAIVWTDMPSALTELFGNDNRRVPVDLTGRTTIRAYCGGTVSAGSGSTLRCMYSLDSGETWANFSSACTVPCDAMAAATSTAIGSAVGIPAEAQGDVLLGFFGQGDGTPTEDPAFTTIGVLVT